MLRKKALAVRIIKELVRPYFQCIDSNSEPKNRENSRS